MYNTKHTLLNCQTPQPNFAKAKVGKQMLGDGFSFLEITIVLAIIAMVVAGGIAIFTQKLQRAAYDETAEKMAVIEEALMKYRLAYNRLPCPTSSYVDNTNAYYGIEASFPGNCLANSFPDTADFGTNVTIAVGALPIYTLGLSEDYMYDGWGRRFRYGVSVYFTELNAFSKYYINYDFDVLNPYFTINNTASSLISDQAIHILVSYGPNKAGSFSRTAAVAPDYAGLATNYINANEVINCKCDLSTGIFDNANLDLFVQGESTESPSDLRDVFDDIIIYKTREQFRGAGE